MTVDLNTVTVIQLGQSRDDNALTLDLDVSDMVAAYPNAAITLIVSRPSDDLPYAGKTELEGNILHWTVTATDTAIAGHGEIQVSCVQDGVTKMSKVVQTEVLRSIDVPGEAPDPLGNYIDDIQNALHAVGPATDRANAAAKRAEDAADRLDPMGAEFEQIAQQVRNDAVSAGQSAEVAKDSAASASKDAALAEIASTDAVTAEGLATKASQAAQKASKDAVQAAADTARDAAHVSDIATGIDTSIQDLEDNKANYKLKVIGQDEVTQMDAREVLTFQDQYEGRLIEFLTNGDYPSKAVAWGYLMTDKSGNTYLVTWNRDATITQWSKDAFEKHLFESKNLINEPIVDIDNLTVDVVGNPPVMYSVRGARNRPPKTSENGTVFVMPHAIDRQLFFYTDMENGKQWVKVVNGTDGQHSFGTWEPLAITKADLLEELARPEYRNLVVNASLSPLGGYSADYNSSEIRNHVNGGGTVELRYVSPELGEQVYAYQKFKDGLAWFRRDVVTDSLVKVIDISVDYQGTVAVKETPYTPDPTLTQPNQAADAKAVGDSLAGKAQINDTAVNTTDAWSSMQILKAFCPEKTVSGGVVAVEPVEHSPLKCVTSFEPIQEGSGDPSPSNVRPIRGVEGLTLNRCGKNITNIPDGSALKSSYLKFSPGLPAGNYTIDIDTTTTKVPLPEYLLLLLYTEPFPGNPAHKAAEVNLSNADGHSRATFYLKEPAAYFLIYAAEYSAPAAGETVTWKNVQISAGSTGHEFEPYHGNDFTATFGQTVYGGTYDWESGKLMATFAKYRFTGDESFTPNADPYWNEQAQFTSPILNQKLYEKVDGIGSFSHGKFNDWFDPSTQLYGSTISKKYYLIGGDKSIIGDTYESIRAYTKAQFDAGTPIEIVYELETPLEIQVTPAQIAALSGTNTIYTDHGETAVTYYADPRAAQCKLEDRIAALESASTQI